MIYKYLIDQQDCLLAQFSKNSYIYISSHLLGISGIWWYINTVVCILWYSFVLYEVHKCKGELQCSLIMVFIKESCPETLTTRCLMMSTSIPVPDDVHFNRIEPKINGRHKPNYTEQITRGNSCTCLLMLSSRKQQQRNSNLLQTDKNLVTLPPILMLHSPSNIQF